MKNISSEKHCRGVENLHGNGDGEERRRQEEITCKKV
jgi:hypothetical protein